MTQKEFLLGLLAKVQHPQDPTDDIFLGLEYLVRQSDVTDAVLASVEQILSIIVHETKRSINAEKLEQSLLLVQQLRQQQESDENIDADLITQLENL